METRQWPYSQSLSRQWTYSHSLFTMQVFLLFSLTPPHSLSLHHQLLAVFVYYKWLGCHWVSLPLITPLSFWIIPISETGSKFRSHYAETPPPLPPSQPWHMFHSTYLVSPCSQFGSGREQTVVWSNKTTNDSDRLKVIKTNMGNVGNTKLVFVCKKTLLFQCLLKQRK